MIFSKLYQDYKVSSTSTNNDKVRGKKNLVLAKCLAGPPGLFVKFSTLQEYGVDRVFYLENNNVDSSQKNIFFLARGDDKKSVASVAGEFAQFHLPTFPHTDIVSKKKPFQTIRDVKVD